MINYHLIMKKFMVRNRCMDSYSLDGISEASYRLINIKYLGLVKISMNIFFLDNDVKKCAQYHCDKHVVKMLVETAQLLCSVYYHTGEKDRSPYRLTHNNHPCSIWARTSLSNWRWLQDLGKELYKEYQFRYGGKSHKSGEIIMGLGEPNLPDIGITTHPQAMPEQYRAADCVAAYRAYYAGEKRHIVKYTKRNFPDWLTN
jgi:hypothetical protein